VIVSGGGLAPSVVQIGFVPLLDAAPLIIASRLGYFADEGLRVTLDRQIGWGNIRDKLTFGQLHAAHALLGMPLFSVLGREWFSEPLTAVMNLGCGADAITFSQRLIDVGATSASSLAAWRRRSRGQQTPPVIAHVFGCSVHHYLLRDWLAAGGVEPDNDVRLCVLPPPQVSRHMAKGYLDGFCCGEPWNSLAAREQTGRIVAVTSDIIPSHPDKVLAVNRRWAEAHSEIVPLLVQAIIRAMKFCSDPQNLSRLVDLLAESEHVGVDAAVIHESLHVGSRWNCFDTAAAFPSVTHHAWYASQMMRWRHLSPAGDVAGLAQRCVSSGAFRQVSEALRIACPPTDAPPMPLRSGQFKIALNATGKTTNASLTSAN
jgi:ABC-type nitrate/sulfonate/bicarbonate transport system substrate-binding protein